jgi:hypothetical protein
MNVRRSYNETRHSNPTTIRRTPATSVFAFAACSAANLSTFARPINSRSLLLCNLATAALSLRRPSCSDRASLRKYRNECFAFRRRIEMRNELEAAPSCRVGAKSFLIPIRRIDHADASSAVGFVLVEGLRKSNRTVRADNRCHQERSFHASPLSLTSDPGVEPKLPD